MPGEADLGTAGFRITGDASGARNASQQAMGALGQLEQIVNTNWWGLQNLALAFSALPAAVAAGVGAAVSAAMTWEDAMAGVGKTTYDTAASIEENDAALASLSGQLLELSTQKPIAPIELAGIAEELGALGVARDDIAEATDVVSDFVATTDVGSEQASAALARLAGFTGLPVEGYRNIASAVLEAGRSTAATESQIVAIVNRIQGVATTFDLSAQSIVGWAAAMATAGVAPEMAGTNFQKTFIDIQSAISKNGEELDLWADIAQQSSSRFAAAFEEDPSNAMQSVIMGLADMQAKGQNVYGTLEELGITEQRQIRLLTTLAGAQNSVSSENLKLSTIMDTTNEAFASGNALAEIANRRYNTVSGQLEILKNSFFAAGAEIGTVMLPALRGIIGVVSDLLTGFQNLPGPVQAVLAVTLGVVTVFSALAAAVFLLLPRLILAQQSFRQLVGAYRGWRTEVQMGAGAERAAVLTKQELAAASIAAAQAHIYEASTAGKLMQAKMALTAAQAREATSAVAYEQARFKATQARLALASREQEQAQARIAMAQAERNAQILAYTQPTRAAQMLQAAKNNLALADQNLIRARVELSVAESQQARTSGNAAVSAQILADAERNLALATDNAERAAWEAVLAQERLTQAQNVNKASTDANTASKQANAFMTSRAAKASALMAAAMAIGTFAMFRSGRAANDAKKETEDFAIANEELVDAMQKGNQAGREQANAWLYQQTSAAGMRGVINDLGISWQQYMGIVRNTATEDEARVFWDTVNQGIASGKEGTEELKAFTDRLVLTYGNAISQARILGATTEDIARVSGLDIPESDFGRSIEDIESYREGVYNLIDAQDQAEDAARSVEDAEENLADARRQAAQAANIIAAAELGVQRARLNQREAADDIRAAERNLASARRRQAREVLDAERALADAQSRYRDSVQAVEDIEEQLAEARKGPELNDMLKATVALAEAQKNLRDANQSVADSQWYLNYLREEGAGARDIREGEDALSDARLDVQNATAGLSDAEKELRELQDKNKQAEEVARLERELADARRDVADASYAISDAEEGLSEARRDAANDTLYKEAQGELLDAQIAQQEAIIETADKEAELQDLRGGSLNRAVTRAQEDLADAYFDQAEALADVAEQLAIINGGTFTEKDRAQILADSLRGLVDTYPELQGVIDMLDEIEAGSSDGGDIPMDFAVDPNIDTSGLEGALDSAAGEGSQFGNDWISTFMSAAFVAMAGAQVAGAFGVTAAAAVSAGAVGVAALAIGGLIWTLQDAAEQEGGYDKVAENIWDNVAAALTGNADDIELSPAANEFQNSLMNGLDKLGLGTWESEDSFDWGFNEAWDSFTEDFGNGLGETPTAIRQGLERFATNLAYTARLAFDTYFGFDILSFMFDEQGNVATPAEVLENIKQAGRDLIGGFIEGAGEKFWGWTASFEQWWNNLVDTIKRILGINSPSTVAKELGLDFIQGFIDGGVEKFWELLGWAGGWKEAILTTIGDVKETLKGKGREIVGGLKTGVDEQWQKVKDFFTGLPEIAKALFINPQDWLFDIGKQVFQGFIDGMAAIWEKVPEPVKDAAEGVVGGLKDLFAVRSPSRVMYDLGIMVALGLNQGLHSGMRDARRQFESDLSAFNAQSIEDNFSNFGIDAFDVAAFTGANASVSYLPPAVAGGSGGGGETVVERTEPHYHLEAITDANPDEIFARFGWGEMTSTRGARR